MDEAFRFRPREEPGLLESLRQAGLGISRLMGYPVTI
jgi:hypothetical protein